MKTIQEHSYLSSDIEAYLTQIKQSLRAAHPNTDDMLQLLDKITDYIRSEEVVKDRMMDEYARIIVSYESRFEEIARLTEN